MEQWRNIGINGVCSSMATSGESVAWQAISISKSNDGVMAAAKKKRKHRQLKAAVCSKASKQHPKKAWQHQKQHSVA